MMMMILLVVTSFYFKYSMVFIIAYILMIQSSNASSTRYVQ